MEHSVFSLTKMQVSQSGGRQTHPSLFLRDPAGMRLCGGSLRLCHTGRLCRLGDVGREAARAGEEEEAIGERGKAADDDDEEEDDEGGEDEDDDDADCCNS